MNFFETLEDTLKQYAGGAEKLGPFESKQEFIDHQATKLDSRLYTQRVLAGIDIGAAFKKNVAATKKLEIYLKKSHYREDFKKILEEVRKNRPNTPLYEHFYGILNN